MHDVLGNGSVKYVVKVKDGQPELVTDILRQVLVSIKIDTGRERYATGRCREIGNEKERGENVRSLVDCYVIQEDECAVEPGFEGPQGIRISISIWRDRRLKLATRRDSLTFAGYANENYLGMPYKRVKHVTRLAAMMPYSHWSVDPKYTNVNLVGGW